MNHLLAIGIVVVLSLIMIGTGIINAKTPKPKGAIAPQCGGCKQLTCGHNPTRGGK